MEWETQLPGRQNPIQAFQLITQQQWTDGRPQQQWRLQNYVCRVLEQNYQWPELAGCEEQRALQLHLRPVSSTLTAAWATIERADFQLACK